MSKREGDASKQNSSLLFLYLLILSLAHGGSAPEINEALNYVADTLLFAGAALVLASALPRAGAV